MSSSGRPSILFSSPFLFVAACLFCFLIAGCSGPRFAGLRPAVASDLAERKLPGQVADFDTLRSDDIIVIELLAADGSTSPIGLVADAKQDVWLIGKSRRFRAPYTRLLNQKLNFKTAPDAPDSVSFARAFVGPTLRAAQQSVGPRFRLSAEPRIMPDLLAAGDIVEMRRQYRLAFALMGEGAPADPFTLTRSEHFDLTIDARGQTHFPTLSLSSLLNNDFNSGDAAEDNRRKAERDALQSDLANADAVLRLADPGAARKDQLSLRALASCLSEGRYFVTPRAPPGDPERNSKCWEAGVKAGLAPETSGSTSIDNLVYSLRAKPRTWHLVDELGRRSELPLVEGETILKTALFHRARLTGRPLFDTFKRRAFVVVVPRPILAADAEAPFYFELRRGVEPAEDYQLWPGDTVVISHNRPRQLN